MMDRESVRTLPLGAAAPAGAEGHGMAAFTVALVGLDGCGKTTVARTLEREDPAAFKYVYMGDNPKSKSHSLPTARWRGGEGDGSSVAAPAKRSASPLRALKKTAGLVGRVMDEAYRQHVAGRYVRRGLVVLFDRHFMLDYHHGDERALEQKASLRRRVHRRLRRWVLSPPDLVIVLDAPAEVAFERKGEFTIEHLRRRRAEYLELQSLFEHTALVDATRTPAQVADDVRERIEQFRNSAGSDDGN